MYIYSSMLPLKKHIALLSLLVFLMPTIISLHHNFDDHEHNTVCTSKSEHHIHKNVEKDCKLCDFTMSSFLNSTFKLNIVFNSSTKKAYPNNYSFLTSFKKLFFSLRAPPSIV